jgi:rhodanese-related sulfurtransferase
LSGGSLLVGAVSRTDLLGHEHAVGFAHQLYHTLHNRILPLGDDVVVYPTHGAGSFCTAAAGEGSSTTIGRERLSNALLRLPDADAFADRLLGSMPSYPTYFLSLRSLNQRGARVLQRVPRLQPLSPHEVQSRQARGDAVVDMRSVHDYARGHIPGVVHVELRPAFASWVGWVVQFGTPLILVSDNVEVHEYAVRQLIRIGYDQLPGYLDGGMPAWARAGLPVACVPVLTMREVRERQAHEWRGGHIPRAQLIEAGSLPSAEVHASGNEMIATHCAHGQRAATGLSVLEQRGFPNLSLVTEGVDEWRAAGGRLDTGLPGPKLASA